MKKKKYKIHPRFYIIVAVLIILVIALCVHFLGGGDLSNKDKTSSGKAQKTQSETAKKSQKKAAARKVSENAPDVSGIKTMPAAYENAASKSEQGTLHELTYSMTVNGTKYKRNALVYLPAGYKKTEKYNVFYLMHGYGGTYHTYLGWESGARPFKNVLDHMIADKKIQPTIVVGVEYDTAYGNYYYGQLDQVSTEIVQALAPAVESKYSTYAESTSEKGLEASRAHRAIGGFSMGGCATWRALKNHANVFQYYLPMSMPMYYYSNGYLQQESKTSAKQIAAGVKSRADGNKIYVFAASGGSDIMNQGTQMQAKDLCAYSGFTWSDPSSSFAKGNVTFYSWPGHLHSYMQTYPYLYNGLMRFFHK